MSEHVVRPEMTVAEAETLVMIAEMGLERSYVNRGVAAKAIAAVREALADADAEAGGG